MMALTRFARDRFVGAIVKAANTSSPSLLIRHIFRPPKPLFRNTHLQPLSQTLRPLCSDASPASFTSPDHLDVVVHVLISRFANQHQPFSQEDSELKALGSRLTSKVVQAVLESLRSWRAALVFFYWASNQYGYQHDCYAYNAMAAILSVARQNAPLTLLTSEMVNSRCAMTPGALGFLLRCLGNRGLVQEANLTFDQVQQKGLCVPNSYTYNCLLEAISKSNQIDLIEARLKEMTDIGWRPDKYTLTPVLQAYCNSGQFEKALDVFNRIFNQGWVDTYILSILVTSFSKWGEVDKAFELIERMEARNIRLNDKSFYVLIHGFVKVSRVDRALQLLDKMRKLGSVPDISVYDVLIGGLCRNNELDKALQLYSEMNESGIPVDFGILEKLASSFSEGEMIRLLKERGNDLDGKSLTLIYNIILNGLVNNGSVGKAYHLVQAIMGKETTGDDEVNNLFKIEGKERVCLDTNSFRIVIDGLCKAGNCDIAVTLFQEMGGIGCRPSELLFNNLIDGLCNSDGLEKSYWLLGEMKKLGFKPTSFTYNSMLGCMCKREDVMGAIELMKEMRVRGYGPWIKYYTLLVKRLCDRGRAEEACDFLSKMVQGGHNPHIIAYSAAIDGLLGIHREDRALELFREICSYGYCPDVVAHNILINGLCKAKRISEAEDVLNEMLAKGLVPSVVTYNSLIDGWCKNGDIDKALHCFSRMIEKKREPSVVTYTTLIDGMCNVRRPDNALVLWNEMCRNGCSPNRITFMALIHGLCKCDRPDAALVYFQEMKEKDMKPDSFIYPALLSALLSVQNPSSAFEVLTEMIKDKCILEPHDKNYTLLRDAVSKLSQDFRTSSGINNLIVGGLLPESLLNADMEEP